MQTVPQKFRTACWTVCVWQCFTKKWKWTKIKIEYCLVFSKRQRITLRLLMAIAIPSVCRLSVTLVHPTQAVELFGNFFSPYDSPGTLVFWCQNSLVGDAPFPWNLRSKWPTPFKTAKCRQISAHSASTVIASDKSWISTYRKSTTRFPTSHRWTVYVTPKSPKGWHKNAISLFVPVKFNFCRKKSATKFLCMKTSSGKL